MTELQFINAMSDKHCITAITNDLMAYANRQYHLGVHKAKSRIRHRSAKRYAREQNRAAALDAAVMAAIVLGVALANWFLTSIRGG